MRSCGSRFSPTSSLSGSGWERSNRRSARWRLSLQRSAHGLLEHDLGALHLHPDSALRGHRHRMDSRLPRRPGCLCDGAEAKGEEGLALTNWNMVALEHWNNVEDRRFEQCSNLQFSNL